MLRYSILRFTVASTSASTSSSSSSNSNNNKSSSGFSSAAFTGDDGGMYAEREKIRSQHTDTAGKSRPTIETYRTMRDEELETLLQTRERQVNELRRVYESFHYEADKCFRTMVFDYHEKALQLSQVHGKMQLGSLQISREALVKMREQQEMYSRDHRLALTVCTVFTFLFWIWVRRHYVRREELFGEEMQLRVAANSPSVTGIGSYGENIFGSAKRSARNVETSWEREVRERREQEEKEEKEKKKK
ncbi:uncharacterized protein TM35_000122330 [Trypanosoma theileri]|uniref:Transmembrane protein n=1 Tax=Trypanosoma theileri TaxID=67003 RepID=A0A1X0NY25_9TRYP|nr:uncharacterized protein TM35_000122330 [Trypanosoma theileri]ORC89458.1 hypothetical protein TM35_000122330 [Trypanosoma theileri]